MNDKSHAKLHICKCGASFDNRRHLIEHVGICNPHWPRTSPNDEHAATPLTAAISELESEPSAGVPSSLAHAETVGERLKRIYPEHYVTIITRMNAERGPKATAIVLNELVNDHIYFGATLSAMFLWARTFEGHEFWKALAKREES